MISKALSLIPRFMLIKFKEVSIPWRINLSVTNLCNAMCKMCNIWRTYKEHPQLINNEMTVEDYRKLFDEVSSHLLWLHITGGEPFLKRDLTKVVEVAASRCNNLVIVDTSTNGLIPKHIVKTTERILEILHTKKIIYGIGISIDGPPDVHDSIRGINGAWDKAIETLITLKKLEASYDNFFVHVNYTITQYNSGYLRMTYELLQKVADLNLSDLSISIEHVGLQFQNFAEQPNHIWANKKETMLEDLKWLLNNMKMVKLTRERLPERLRFKFKEYFTELATQYIIDPSKRYFKCEALRSSVFIDPYGNVFPCTIWSFKLGNIREESLKKILYSPPSLRARRLIINERCPNCLSGCEIWPSLLLHKWGLILSEVI
ncbi:MAG: radical SAM protein [Desulfurococcaceae archaeon]